MIKNIKIGNLAYDAFEEKTIAEDGTVTWNIPQDRNEFRAIALDTLNWRAGKEVKNVAANQNAANAKAIALVVKLMSPSDTQLNTLTTTERSSWDKMKTLADNGYADSHLLYTTLTAVLSAVQEAEEKAGRVMAAETIDTIIDILNED